MELRDYVRLVRKNWWLLLALTVIGFVGAGLYTFTRTPLYESQSKVVVTIQNASTVSDLQQGSTFTDNRIATYTALATTPAVLDEVLERTGLDESATKLAESVTASNPTNTTFIVIVATDPRPATAAKIANATAVALGSKVEQIETPIGQRTSPVKVTQVQAASTAPRPSSPNIPLFLSLGVVAGLALGIAVAALREALNTRVRSVSDIEELDQVPVLGSVTFDKRVRRQPLIVHDEPHGRRAESFRTLRTNLSFLGIDGPRSFVLTSGTPSEGKSTTAVNLALALADAGFSTALVDADLRSPSVAEYLGIEGGSGLTDVLVGRADASKLLQQWGNRPLWVLPSGRRPPNPSELLGSARMIELLSELEERFDFVLLDSPPVLSVTDPVILAARVTGTIVTVHAGRARRAELQAALVALRSAGAAVSGVVLTMVPKRGPDAYGYGYGGHYRYYGTTAADPATDG